MVLPDLESAVQCGSGDLECPANIQNGVAGVIELLGNTALLYSNDFGSAAFFSSGAGCGQSCLRPFPNEISLKLRQCTKDVKD
jgi:hypothetical protein